jgi:beta-mannosidase
MSTTPGCWAWRREAGINFLRVWGGGVREKRAFWETCDRLGIMAWQEFPLACAFLDHYPRDAAYLSALAGEARGIVRGLRNHPSLIAWCGGNEINPARERLPLQTLAAVLAEEDPARPWIPASPSDGDVHQWQVWHGLAPWADYADTGAPFMSEFGLQALPDASTVAEMFPAGATASLDDPRWAAAKAQAAKLRHYAGPDVGGDMLAAIAATQRAQATALQVGVEGCRLRRERGGRFSPHPSEGRACPERVEAGAGGVRCGGVAFWQLNEPWSAVSWSVIDRAGRPKAAYEILRRSYQPILIAARFPWRSYAISDAFQAEIWLVNDGPKAYQGCRADAILDGEAVRSAEEIKLPPAGATQIGELNLTLVTFPRFLSLALCCGEAILATNRYDLAVHLPGRQPQRTRLIHWTAERLLETD